MSPMVRYVRKQHLRNVWKYVLRVFARVASLIRLIISLDDGKYVIHLIALGDLFGRCR